MEIFYETLKVGFVDPMVLAGLVGLFVAKVTTGRAGRRGYLLVERYDRIVRSGRITRIHQEDFCQLLGYFPSSKYETLHPRCCEGARGA